MKAKIWYEVGMQFKKIMFPQDGAFTLTESEQDTLQDSNFICI